MFFSLSFTSGGAQPSSSGDGGRRPSTRSSISSTTRQSHRRPSSNLHHRPSSTLHNRPRSTGVCRARSARFTWPATRWENIDVVHLPPTGPDCLPGCGYSGLPCYACSSKGYIDPDKRNEQTQHGFFGGAGYDIWTIFGNRNSSSRAQVDPFPVPVHLPRRGHNTRFTGPPPTYRSLFPTVGVTDCCQKFRQSVGLPRACSSQFMIILALVYGLLISHLFWTAFS